MLQGKKRRIGRSRENEPNLGIASGTHVFSVNLFIGFDARTLTTRGQGGSQKKRRITDRGEQNESKTARRNEENKRVDRVTEY